MSLNPICPLNNTSSNWLQPNWDNLKSLVKKTAAVISSSPAILLPMAVAMSLPAVSGEYTNSSLTECPLVNPAPSEVGFLQDAAMITAVGLQTCLLIGGLLGVDRHVHGNPLQLLQERMVGADPFDTTMMTTAISEESSELQENLIDGKQVSAKKITQESGPIVPTQIINTNTFANTDIGSIALFAHQNRFTHLAIAMGQEFLNLEQFGTNITHAAIVSEKQDDESISLYEIPNATSRISEIFYKLSNFKLHEEALFFNPSLTLPEAERSTFINYLLQISKTFIDHAAKIPELQGQYNFNGLLKLAVEPATFFPSDWMTLLDDLLEYGLLTECEKSEYIPKQIQYFCSEFVLRKIQLARFIQTCPEIYEKIKAALKPNPPIDLQQRKQVVEQLYQESADTGVFNQLLQDPLFFIPPRSVTPAHFIQLAQTHQLPIHRVTNPDGKPEHDLETGVSHWLRKSLAGESIPQPTPMQCNMPEEIENHLRVLEQKHLHRESIDPDNYSLQCLIHFLLKQPEYHGYSKETLLCFFMQGIQAPAQELPSRIGSCIDNTFTWTEKIKLALTSIAIDHSIDRLIQTGQLENFLDAFFNESIAARAPVNQQRLIELLFPVNDCSFFSLDCLENFLAAEYMKHGLSAADIYKYGPLAILGMEEIFKSFGIEYRSPVDRLKSFAMHYASQKLKRNRLQ